MIVMHTVTKLMNLYGFCLAENCHHVDNFIKIIMHGGLRVERKYFKISKNTILWWVEPVRNDDVYGDE